MARKRIPKVVLRTIRDYVSELNKDHLPIQKVYLFGSYAKGSAHQWSDIDLCIISSRFTDPWKATQYLWSKRISDSGITIEPVGFSPKDFRESSPLVEQIQKTGVEIQYALLSLEHTPYLKEKADQGFTTLSIVPAAAGASRYGTEYSNTERTIMRLRAITQAGSQDAEQEIYDDLLPLKPNQECQTDGSIYWKKL